MKKLYFLLLLGINFLYSQTLPYTNNFNSPSSDENWTHFAITGTDDWGRGMASGLIDASNLSWETKLNDTPSTSSNMVLQSPSFDLTNANLPYVLSFKYKSNLNSGNLYLEYSIDNGTTWILLNRTDSLKKNWQSTGGFSLSTTNFTQPAINLSFLQGNENVIFRYRFRTNSYCNGYGFVIDDFSIAPEYYNVFAGIGSPVEISPLCPQIKIKTGYGFDNQYASSYLTVSEFYLSNDMILDGNDTLLYSQNLNVNTTILNYEVTLATPQNLQPGQYYILYKFDASNVVSENNENDNVGYCSLIIRPIFNLPYSTDFEVADDNWKTDIGANTTIPLLWERGSGTRHHIEKAHSGVSAWHTGKTIVEHPEYTFQTVESPYFNLSSSTESLILNFWFKNHYPGGVNYYDNEYKVQYSLNCSSTWTDLIVIPANLSDEWESITIPLNATISANSNVKFRISYHAMYLKPEGIIFDDFYVGPTRPDLSIEKIYSNKRFTSANAPSDVLKYEIRNAGGNLTQISSVKFYWSNDSLFDSNDVLLGEQPLPTLIGDNSGQWMSFTYSKPTTAIGNYFIIYNLDSNNQIVELRENNNIGAIPIQQIVTASFPYYNDFETTGNDWNHEATLGVDEWNFGTPQGLVLDTAFSGNNAWLCSAPNGVSSMSRTHLYTPSFNLSTSENPVLEFDMKLHNYGGCSCFELTLNMSYSIDNGATWIVLEPINNSYSKWSNIMKYNENSALDDNYMIVYTEKMFAQSEKAFSNFKHYNSRDIDRNTKYIINISQLKDETNVRFRYNLSTLLNDGTSANSGILEGVLIDNFQIREAGIDLNVPYVKNLYVSSLANKLNFSIDIKNSGNYISNPTDVKFYLSNDAIYNSGDYYLGNTTLEAIRPDFKSHKILEYNLPSNLSSYAYLIYVIDDANTNVEVSETNNQGAWELGLSGINTFPYSENFEADIINGWKGYAYEDFTSSIMTNYRVTNRIAVGLENNIYRRNYNGVLRTENVPYGAWQDYLTPKYYIQTPVFNFTTYTSSEPLIMAFDLMSIGKNNTNGSNMDYSIDGGTTWNLLTTASGPTFNWYQNFSTMSDFNQAGWFQQDGEIKSVKMNISFLQNQSNVIFRYKYYSNHATASSNPRGLRIDNFSIGQESLVSELNCFENIPYTMNFDAVETTCWEFGADDDAVILLDRLVDNDIQWEVSPNFANQTSNAAIKINLIGQGNTNGVWFISPNFNMIPGNKLRFNVALNQLGNLNATNLGADDSIILKYTINNGLTWTDLKTWNNTSVISNTGQMVLVNSLPTSGYARFAFWATNGVLTNDNSTFYIDDFVLYTGALDVNQNETFKFTYFPNPVNDFLTIYSEKEEIKNIETFTVSGQLIESIKVNKMESKIDFRNYASGVYFVKVNAMDNSKTIKILK